MHYLITGTAGFIGFHLARRLLSEGHSVTGYDAVTDYYDVSLKEKRLSMLKAFEGFTEVRALLEDKAALEAAVAAKKPDVIVHLAAQAGVRYSLENPGAYVSSNLVGSWNILEVARQINVGHLLLASTSSVYGGNDKFPFAENDNTDQPLTLYAATKKAMEVMAHSYSHLYKVPTTTFRFFTVYGPWGRPDMALFKFTEAMLNGRPIEVYGEGKMSRDFTYVSDLVESIVRLCNMPPSEENRVTAPDFEDSLSKNAPFRVVNIGGGQPVELIRFVETVEETLGLPPNRTLLPMQKGDVPRTFAAPDLLKALTGYVPETPVETGIREFVRWYREWKGFPNAPTE